MLDLLVCRCVHGWHGICDVCTGIAFKSSTALLATFAIGCFVFLNFCAAFLDNEKTLDQYKGCRCYRPDQQ